MVGIKLYPPTIPEIIPAFYRDNYTDIEDGTTKTKIVVPCSLNKGINLSDIYGFSLKIKTVQTNKILYENIFNAEVTLYNSEINFILSENDFFENNNIQIGQFFKIQIACVKSNNGVEGNVGYYSNVGIIKYTSKPEVYIDNFNEVKEYDDYQVNPFPIAVCTGGYSTEDVTEQPEYYKFSLLDITKNEIESSGWLLYDNNYNYSSYQFKTNPEPNEQYLIQYSIKTINQLEINSPLYECIEINVEELGFESYVPVIDLKVKNIFEEGYIQLSLLDLHSLTFQDFALYIKNKYKFNSGDIIGAGNHYRYFNDNFNSNNPYVTVQDITTSNAHYYYVECINMNNIDKKQRYYSINFNENPTISLEISRSENTNNFEHWKVLQKVSFSSWNDFNNWIFKDFAIEQGVIYKYSFRLFNKNNLSSNRYCSTEILADFEDMFLCDNEHQIKIRFNPKVSSFKIDQLETKTDTIGSKYPFIFKNKTVKYKEFPISGLISYHLDKNNLFTNNLNIIYGDSLEREENPSENILFDQNIDTTNLVNYNIKAERDFKLQLLDWLGNGEIKLFKSPSEGNYFVRLMNVSLSPEDRLNRMLHSFSCTAYEVKDYNYNNLIEENFYNLSDPIQIADCIGKIKNVSVSQKTISGDLWQNQNTSSSDSSMITHDKANKFKIIQNHNQIKLIINDDENNSYIIYKSSNIFIKRKKMIQKYSNISDNDFMSLALNFEKGTNYKNNNSNEHLFRINENHLPEKYSAYPGFLAQGYLDAYYYLIETIDNYSNKQYNVDGTVHWIPSINYIRFGDYPFNNFNKLFDLGTGAFLSFYTIDIIEKNSN